MACDEPKSRNGNDRGARLSGNKSGPQRNDRLFTGNLDPNSPVEAEQNAFRSSAMRIPGGAGRGPVRARQRAGGRVGDVFRPHTAHAPWPCRDGVEVLNEREVLDACQLVAPRRRREERDCGGRVQKKGTGPRQGVVRVERWPRHLDLPPGNGFIYAGKAPKPDRDEDSFGGGDRRNLISRSSGSPPRFRSKAPPASGSFFPYPGLGYSAPAGRRSKRREQAMAVAKVTGDTKGVVRDNEVVEWRGSLR
ncbi:hypothetical protein DdX_20471 [Ditylenchus destructor]|uniref:Uncharacterized protein n=1 Tax=Ditylenchus destructor TaxID=166010 RepID=A0AAD4QWJ0_9BILA|nr:hypothetical protein DdX_20471 [Ditylenchus destructor]